MRYLIVIQKDPDSDYGVTVPDLPGCFSAGSTPRDAMDNAKEAIECHVEGMLADGEPIPKPDPDDEEAHLLNPDYRGGFFVYIDIDERKLSGKVQRINITVPEYVLAQIDAYVEEHGETRSGFLSTAALAVIGQPARRKERVLRRAMEASRRRVAAKRKATDEQSAAKPVVEAPKPAKRRAPRKGRGSASSK